MITGRTSHAAACRQRTHTCIALRPKPGLDRVPLCRVGVLHNTPETPILQQVLRRAPCPAWLSRRPLETSAFPPRSCFTCSAGPHSGLHGGLFTETRLAHWRYTNWGGWKTFVCKGGTVSPRRRMGMCALHRPVLCRGFAPFPSLPDLSPRMPRLPSQGGTCPRSAHQDPSPRGL